MNIQQAIECLMKGQKVKLPEWSGYWFMPDGVLTDPVETRIRVFTKDGDILDSPWVEKYKDRTDFEVTYGKLGFDFAVRALKNGKHVSRHGWGKGGIYLTMQVPDEHSKMTRRYFYITVEPGCSKQFEENKPQLHRMPWVPNQTDMLAEDWYLVEI